MNSRKRNQKRSRAAGERKYRTVRRGRQTGIVPQRAIITQRDYATPNSMNYRFVFQDQRTILNLGGSLVAHRYAPNNVFDLDPTVGTTTAIGFTEASALYGKYQMEVYWYDLEICNNDNVPVTVFLIHTNVDPGNSGVNYNLLARNSTINKSMMLSAKGGLDRVRWRGKVSIRRLVGKDVRFDDTFAAAVTAAPANITFMGIGVQSTAGVLTNGISYNLTMVLGTRMFEKVLILS